MDLSIVIVNHNTKKLTEQTIQSVFDTTKNISYEIIVADNSTDPSQVLDMKDDRVKILKNLENKGFGNACNIGTKVAIGKYILYLNSDTIMKSHTTPFNSLCYVLRLDKLFPNNKKFGGYTLSYLPIEETNEVDSVSGAFMLIPRTVLNKVGLFDESIFMYAEDIDLCYRIKQRGYKVVYYADVSMTHLKGQSGLHTKNKLVIYHFHKGIKIFYDKYYKDKHNFFVTFLMHSAINLRYVVTLLRSKLRR